MTPPGATRRAGPLAGRFRPDSPVWAVLAGTALRVFWLDRLSFWLDEAFTVKVSEQPVGGILTYTGDPHPPLYHLIMHYWLSLGDSEVWARLPSALLGSLTIPALYYLGRTLFGKQVGLAAAWLLALSPWHLWYSQETRMYAAVCLMGTLALLCGARWLADRHPAFLVLYILTTLAGLYLEYTMLLLWPVAVVLLLIWGRGKVDRRTALAWIGVQSIILAGYVPWLGHLQADIAFFLPIGALRLPVGRLGDFAGPAAAGALAAGVALVAGAVWLIRQRPVLSKQVAIRGGLLLLGFAVVLMLIPGGLTLKRAGLIFAPLVFLAAGWALEQVPGRLLRLRNVALVSLLAVVLMMVLLPKEPWREVVNQVHSLAQPGDIVLIEAGWMTIPFDYYDQGRTVREGLAPSALDNRLSDHLKSYRRIWLILAQATLADPAGQAPRWMAGHYALEQSLEYYQIQVRLYKGPAE